MVIRPLAEPDLPAVLDILNREIREGTAHFATEPQTLDRLSADWRGRSPAHPWLVADFDGDIAGLVRASPWKSRGAYLWTAEMGVYVSPQHRRHGLGRALCQHLLRGLEDAGIRTVLAGIALPNDPSVRLHEQLGMTRVATFPAIGFKQGRWIDVGYWSRRLGPPDQPPTGAAP